ncbi:MAG TPA: thiamine pyrophosphate-binding protein [Caulobacteraceae bacterium]
MPALALVQPLPAPRRSAAQALVDQLVVHGVTHVFCVPGESFLGVLDALHDSPIAVTTCRNEGGAAMMAEASGKATGRPGICFVTRGPGAANATPGIHIAGQDSTPMIMFVGQVELAVRERDAFQELDYRAVFSSMTKWTTEIEEASRVPEIVSRAFHAATAGRPGPVVVALPRDILSQSIDAPDAPPFQPIEASPGAEELARLETLLGEAQRPFLILGGSRWDETACAAIAQFAKRFSLPVATSYRRAPLFDALHPCYAGDLGIGANPELIARIKRADLVIALGGRLNEIASQGYSLFEIPGPKTRLVHIHAGAEELGRVYSPHLAILASPRRAAAALAKLRPAAPPPWRDETAAAHLGYLRWSQGPTPQAGAVNLGEIMVWLRENLAPETVLCNGAGNYAAWIHRFYRFRRFGTHFAPISASMGYGVPAAVAIKRLMPEKEVVSISGDGDFLMNGQEFAIARQYRLPIVFLIFDNAMYGTIRMHQEREFPGRVTATDLENPDFAAYARAFGGFGATVGKTSDFPAAFAAAKASGLPAIVHVKFDPDGITPATSLSRIRREAEGRLGKD